jgi:tripartite-type tricarboxylate transporter receptor subunit TctC
MRRHLLLALAAAAIAGLPGTSVLAQGWPAAGKTVQIIVPAPGGGGTGDTIARIVAEQLALRLKVPVIVDNKGGANGNIGAAAAAQAPADGYHLLFSWAGTLAVNPSLYKKLSFDPRRDFEPIGLIADVPNIIVINNDLPPKDVAELAAYAKANPEKLHFGSTGNGSSMHLAGALFMRETGTKMVHVPYSAPGLATTNLMAGDIQLMFQLVPGIVGQVKGGKVRALAVMSEARSPALPDVPTTAERGYPALQSSTWFALLAPKGTPAEILDRLNAELNDVLKSADVRKRFTDLGAAPISGTRAALRDYLAAETTKWAKVVAEANVSIE